MTRFAYGTHAKGICDMCGLTCMLRDLRVLVANGKPTGSKVCDDCWTPDHPQNFVGRNVRPDAEALNGARPDTKARDTNVTWGWSPVQGVQAEVAIGTVTTT